MKKTWEEKLNTAKAHYVKRLNKNIAGMKAGQMMLIPSALLIDGFIKAIPYGKIHSTIALRQQLAQQHNADITCPIATGFAMRIVAEAAFEKFNAGSSLSKITPIWRAIDKDSKTLKKCHSIANFLRSNGKLNKVNLARYFSTACKISSTTLETTLSPEVTIKSASCS